MAVLADYPDDEMDASSEPAEAEALADACSDAAEPAEAAAGAAKSAEAAAGAAESAEAAPPKPRGWSALSLKERIATLRILHGRNAP